MWPRVRQFLTTNQFTVLRADATGGVIETAWLNPAQAVAASVIVSALSRACSAALRKCMYCRPIVRPVRSIGRRLHQTSSVNEMMKAVAQFIADNGGGGAVSMLAQKGIDAQGKVFLERKAGQPQHLRLALPFNRAWASLEIALPKAGFAVDDTNPGERYLSVRYDPPGKQGC